MQFEPLLVQFLPDSTLIHMITKVRMYVHAQYICTNSMMLWGLQWWVIISCTSSNGLTLNSSKLHMYSVAVYG